MTTMTNSFKENNNQFCIGDRNCSNLRNGDICKMTNYVIFDLKDNEKLIRHHLLDLVWFEKEQAANTTALPKMKKASIILFIRRELEKKKINPL